MHEIVKVRRPVVGEKVVRDAATHNRARCNWERVPPRCSRRGPSAPARRLCVTLRPITRARCNWEKAPPRYSAASTSAY